MSLHIVECGILQPCQPKCNSSHGKIKFKVVAKGDFWKHMVFNIFHSISATTNRTKPKYVG